MMTIANLKLHSLATLSQSPIFWVITSLTLVMLPHLNRFSWWSIILIAGLFLWRMLAINHRQRLAPKWMIFLIGLISFIAIFLYYGSLFGKTAGSNILAILLALKLHESLSRRDYMFLISLSFFIIVTNFFFSQSIPTVIYMLLSIIVLIVSMLSINQQSAAISLKYKLTYSTKILLQSIPLALILFIFFPRISGPLWQLPDDKLSAKTGLSSTMSPGNISELIQSNALAFRVKFDSAIPAQNKLYWRALVLWYFDGETWEQGKYNPSPLSTLFTANNNSTQYTITMQAHNENWLYALDMPSEVPTSIIYTNNYTLRSPTPITSLHQYRISSVLNYYSTHPLSPWEKSAALKIPVNTNPRTIDLAKKLARQYDTNQQIINHVLQLFNQQNFHYTLKPPLMPGFDSVDQFLFDTKRGFCEHYTSSFTLIMRAAGIPARVVLGFQGGTINPLNNILSVHNSDAHAWSEVWINNKGWVRVDPTAAVAPERVEKSLDAAIGSNEALPFHMKINTGMIRDLLFYWDAIDNHWNQWIVGYDKKIQQQFLEQLFDKKMSLADKVIMMFAAITFVFLLLYLFAFKADRKEKLDPVAKLYQKFCNKLALKGLKRAVHEGPVDYANRAINKLPAHKDSINLITRLYIKIHYESAHSEKQLSQFKQQIGDFKPK